MTLAQLQASRALWRRREVYRFKKWHATKSPKWAKLYAEARDQRRKRDRQIADKSNVPFSAVLLVAGFEGFSSKPYRDAVGVWTQGYGETKDVGPNSKPVSRLRALYRLRKRLNDDFYPAVKAANAHLNARARGGFTSFVYNVGIGGVAASTGVGRALRANNIVGAAAAIRAWNKAGGRVLLGLDNRRKAEQRYILGH